MAWTIPGGCESLRWLETRPRRTASKGMVAKMLVLEYVHAIKGRMRAEMPEVKGSTRFATNNRWLEPAAVEALVDALNRSNP
jgi:hypothetical protein